MVSDFEACINHFGFFRVDVFRSRYRLGCRKQEADGKVVLDGKAVDFGSGVVINKGKIFVEYGVFFKQLGYVTEFDQTTQTIFAASEETNIELSVGGDKAVVNGQTVPSKGEVISLGGKKLVGLRFIAAITDYKAEWNGKAKTISLTYQGPTAEQKAAVYDVFDKMLLLEAAGDATGFAALIAEDTEMDTKSIMEQWKNVRTKTTIEDKFIQSYTDTVAVVILIEDTIKVSGGFFADNKSQTMYTLHRASDGNWKVYNVEPMAVEYTNVPGLFNQEATIPEADKAAIGQVFADQIKAANEKTWMLISRHWRMFKTKRH